MYVCINIDKRIFLNILFVHRVGEVIGLKRLIYFTGPPFVLKVQMTFTLKCKPNSC